MPDDSAPLHGHSRRMSHSLAWTQDKLRGLLRQCENGEQVDGLAAVLREVSKLRRLIDMPRPEDSRRDPRMPSRIGTTCIIAGVEIDCAIEDLSIGGAKIILDAPLKPDTLLDLVVPEAGNIRGVVVAVSGNAAHIVFEGLEERQTLAIIDKLEAAYW
ncbi:MAG: PilZ domain-containing protein [Proteobacteria bacterium]|nr:PilZ domain-containing protein [Pseudomonadota bacterium]